MFVLDWRFFVIRNHYSIAEAAVRVGIKAWTLRRLESQGRIPAARRDPLCGARVYDADDIETIRKIIADMGGAYVHAAS